MQYVGRASGEIPLKHKTVVIDPPWLLQASLKKMCGKKGYHSNLPYKTMTDSEIMAFPINDFADEQCDLFMWTTHTKLPVALSILQAWGFKFHVLLAWDKLSGVCMNGFYRQTEFVVYGYRGKQGVDVGEGSYIPTLFKAKANGHSRKPDIFYKIIGERTQAPRIDIFARKRHFGFEAYGDEVEKDMEMPLVLCYSEIKK
jgi:N6-adenosine-specific RNA methylase IME4